MRNEREIRIAPLLFFGILVVALFVSGLALSVRNWYWAILSTDIAFVFLAIFFWGHWLWTEGELRRLRKRQEGGE